jgi:hypothetical protein
MSTPEPDRRIDYVLLSDPASRLLPQTIERLGFRPDSQGFYPSDHCGLKAAFRLD